MTNPHVQGPLMAPLFTETFAEYWCMQYECMCYASLLYHEPQQKTLNQHQMIHLQWIENVINPLNAGCSKCKSFYARPGHSEFMMCESLFLTSFSQPAAMLNRTCSILFMKQYRWCKMSQEGLFKEKEERTSLFWSDDWIQFVDSERNVG